MRLQIEIESEDASAKEYPKELVYFVLGTITASIHQGADSGIVRDPNGNKIGRWEFKL